MSPQTTKVLKAGPYRLDLSRRTHVMGIINVTPDSFSRDGLGAASADTCRRAVRQAARFVRQGADILDIGGESTRPGAARVTVQEELDRVIPVIQALKKRFDIPLSVDTYKATVAEEALRAGAVIVNNIMGIRKNDRLTRAVKDHRAALILMHIRGIPRTMQRKIFYKDVVADVFQQLSEALRRARRAGLEADQLVVDPGLGFGKTVEHNLRLVRELRRFCRLGVPVLLGPSRKSFIGQVLGREVKDRLTGTIATVCVGVINGAAIVRVHDVKQAWEAVRMTDALLGKSG